jgi:uncharacterized protein (TIGR03435 family)
MTSLSASFEMTLSRVPTLSAPDWITGAESRYDILAKMPPGATPGQAPRMMQALLAERFQLEFRHEHRVLPHYALVVAKDGPRMPKATSAPVNAPAGVNGQLHIPSNRMPMSGVVSACLDSGRSPGTGGPAWSLDFHRRSGTVGSQTGLAERADGRHGHRSRRKNSG